MPFGKSFIIKNVNVFAEEQTIDNGYIKVIEDKIVAFGDVQDLIYEENSKIFSFSPEYRCLPGMIDMHIHGVAGADIMDASNESMDIMVQRLPAEGTTSFLATTMTQTPEIIENVLSHTAQYIDEKQVVGSAEILGIHLEGPFISKKKAGAQPESHIIPPNLSLFKQWQNRSRGHIKLVTLAPEEAGGLELIAFLQNQGVIASIGHSNARFEQVKEAVYAGATHVTHLYNGMSGMHHREPGVAGAALLQDDLTVEIIADGIHIRPEMVELAYRMKTANRLVLVTDSMRAKCLKNGEYDLGGQRVRVQDNRATLKEGTLAGSILKMQDAVINMKHFISCTTEELIQMTAVNPAKELRMFDRKGSIAVGKDADLVIFDQNNEVVMTFCRGKMAYRREDVL